MGPRKNSSFFNLLDSFMKSINRMGENSSWITAFLFVAGGLLSFYVGYSDNYMPSLIGGPVTILIGLIIFYKAWQISQKSRRNRKHKRVQKRSVPTP
jgi:hypothetical protein